MLQVNINNQQSINIEKLNDQWQLDGIPVDPDIQWQNNGQISLILNNKSHIAQIEKLDKEAKELVLRVNGQRYTMTIKEEIDLLLDKMGINMSALQKAAPLKAPMPGMVLKILVGEGQTVNKGDGLLILEAMKMENVLKAGSTATIKSIKVVEKTAVEKGTVLIEME